MVGLGQSLERLRGNGMGRVLRALHEYVFPAYSQHAEAQEFLKLRQGTMIVLDTWISLLN